MRNFNYQIFWFRIKKLVVLNKYRNKILILKEKFVVIRGINLKNQLIKVHLSQFKIMILRILIKINQLKQIMQEFKLKSNKYKQIILKVKFLVYLKRDLVPVIKNMKKINRSTKETNTNITITIAIKKYNPKIQK